MAKMEYITKRCTFCDAIAKFSVTAEEMVKIEKGVPIANIFPDYDEYQIETLRSGTCKKCLAVTYDIPTEGQQWGEREGTCPVCSSTVWRTRDAIPDMKNKYKCFSCDAILKRVAFKTLIEDKEN